MLFYQYGVLLEDKISFLHYVTTVRVPSEVFITSAASLFPHDIVEF